ncbi:hypothetical protein DAPPUDRAFT_235202 [Daphnia pulex]|uniref:BTB domain-containing protein n=1 Tax=Daphnia pulex TaxID=6669 RepID=E9FYG6_DAPPU|nr:hypothetical protein DAPPUDRAFT_235202 [Daphnia pulex]|eukprot:EFX87525.1 hypothetical protein DAPPUDRAFT_235202 [Daphnia pulex]
MYDEPCVTIGDGEGRPVESPTNAATAPFSMMNSIHPGSGEVVEMIKPATILGTSMMMVTYRWKLEVDGIDEHKTISSRMLCFRDEKVFRVGLKNCDKPTLIFVAIDLNNIGLRVREAGFYSENDVLSRQKMTHNNVDGESLQLFTYDLAETVVGHCTFVFSIWLEGSVPGCYSYQLSDRLVKRQLWESQHYVDVEFVCKDKKFSAHKAILAARSSVFADQFDSELPRQKSDGPLQINIDDVESTVFEQFLHFLYTGEPKIPMLDNQQLLQLAILYQLDTLVELCQIAVKKIDVMQMASFVSNLELNQTEPPASVIISPDKNSYVTHGHPESTFRVVWIFEGRESAEKPLAIDYQNENLFSIHLKDGIVHFICVNHRKFVIQVLYSINCSNWIEMKLKNVRQQLVKSEMLFFAAQVDVNFEQLFQQSIVFDIQMVYSTIADYCYEMVDVSWMTQLWEAALGCRHTDVEIFVGQNKLMEGHQMILSARSPVLNGLLCNLKENGKSRISFHKEIDAHVVEHFLYFLYTGSSRMTFKNKQLLGLAEMHQVETLTKVCELAIVASPDVEEVTNFLLSNF